MNIKCIQCKGRNLCHRPVCPIISKISSQKKVNLTSKQDFFGEAPNIFVGKYGYPDVNVGILGVENYVDNDAPLLWSKENYQIDNIVDLRSSLVNSRFGANVKSFDNKFLEMSQEISMASKPVDVEINLQKRPQFNVSFNQDIMPHGPSVELKKAMLTENPKIPTKVDSIVSQTDLKSVEALETLYDKKFDEHYLTKLLSVGNLGVKDQRRLVPTRWSITAVDDTLGKHLISNVKKHAECDYAAHFGGYLGNYYLILFFPDIWEYELFETPVVGGNTGFTTDHETYAGRTKYAFSTAGGYYAARIAVLEKLNTIKRQGACLCLRFITDEYWAPLGVWVVREASRNSMKSKPLMFGSEELMMIYAKNLVKKKFGYDLDNILKVSKLIKERKSQKKLSKFL
jgi:DNA repair protein NreA